MNMDPFRVKEGTAVFFGAPAKPLPRETSDAITRLVQSTAGIVEAHLPQCYVEGAPAAAQILVVVPDTGVELSALLQAIGVGLRGIMPREASLDVWPLAAGTPLMEAVREARCQIFAVSQ